MSESDFTPADIARLYEEHYVEEIAQITALLPYQIYAVLSELGVSRPQGREPYYEHPGIEYLFSLQEHGFSQRDIANYEQVSKTTVQRWLNGED